MNNSDSSPPPDPEKRARVAALYRQCGLCPPWEMDPRKVARLEEVWREMLTELEPPASQLN